MKFRIRQLAWSGKYVLERKGWLFWWTIGRDHQSFPIEYNTIEEAKRDLESYKKAKATKSVVVWEEV